MSALPLPFGLELERQPAEGVSLLLVLYLPENRYACLQCQATLQSSVVIGSYS